jgi:hypothetical protein
MMTEKHNTMASEKMSLEEAINQYRLEICAKESYLVSTFRELMSCDYDVAANHFNKE